MGVHTLLEVTEKNDPSYNVQMQSLRHTKVKRFADFITFVPTAISNSNSNCVVGIVEDVESVASVSGGDIAQRSIS